MRLMTIHNDELTMFGWEENLLKVNFPSINDADVSSLW
jgi:hypothetical protein